MLIEKVEGVNAEALARLFGHVLDALRAAVGAVRSFGVLETELRRDHDFPLEGFKGFADEFFVGEGAIDFRRVEEGDATIHGSVKKRDHLLLRADGASPKLIRMQPRPMAETSKPLL